ncbi:MAG: hypothetical protein QW597_05875 [Thermoplasmataceae archaeon]
MKITIRPVKPTKGPAIGEIAPLPSGKPTGEYTVLIPKNHGSQLGKLRRNWKSKSGFLKLTIGSFFLVRRLADNVNAKSHLPYSKYIASDSKISATIILNTDCEYFEQWRNTGEKWNVSRDS